MTASTRARILGGALAITTAILGGQALTAPAVAAPDGSGLVITEVYGGGGNSGASYRRDFIELYNPTDVAIDVSGYSVAYFSAGGGKGGQHALTGAVPAHSHYLIEESAGSGGTVDLPQPDASGSLALSATAGRVVLLDTTASISSLPAGNVVGTPGFVDFVGFGSAASFEGSGPTPGTANATSVARSEAVDTDDNAADFLVGAPGPQNAASDAGEDGGDPGEGGDGGDPGDPADGGDDGDGTSPELTPIAAIQGTNTDTSPLAGQTVTTEGVVTAVYATGGFNGFFLQTGGSGGTPAQDATPGASDAIFVYGSGPAAQVEIGDSVRVTGAVSEYQGETELSNVTVTELPTPLPAVLPAVIPWSELDTDAEKEAHEGELIAPQGAFTVSDNYDTNYYGSFTLAAGETPLRQPTDAAPADSAAAHAVAADNAARAITLDDGASTNFNSNANKSIPLPWLTPERSVTVGASVTFIAPVILDYRFSLWNLQPVSPVTGDGREVATFSDLRSGNASGPQEVGGDVRLATFNVENFFPLTGEAYVAKGLGTCTYYTDRDGDRIAVNTCTGTDGSAGPRGAATDESYQRQLAKIVTGITRLGASIVSLEEIENSVKFGEDRDAALAALVEALNAAEGSEAWAYVPSPGAGELPALDEQDVIRTAFIYRPADISPVGASVVLKDLSQEGEPFSIAREPLAQAFKKAGAQDADAFLVVANHWKSKGSGTPLYPGDEADTSSPAADQGAFNATRIEEAKAVRDWADEIAGDRGTDRILLVGDFNAYTQEDPLQVLYQAGYTDLGSALDPGEHTYSFDGLAGSLDHVLANAAALELVTGADIWQINAQEPIAYSYSRYDYNATLLFDATDPFAASDHDPEIVGLTLPDSTPSAPAWDASKVYNAGDEVVYRGSTWLASWWTRGQEPGDPYGPWQELASAADGTILWTPSRIFTGGEVVQYRGERYQAKWWTRNQEPGDPYGPWAPKG